MRLIRRFFKGVIALVLLISLLSLALSGSLKLTTSNRSQIVNSATKTEAYSEFVNNAVTNANKVLSQNGAVSLTTPIKQAAQTALPKSQFNGYLETLVNANLNWLEGKTKVPQFKLDLSNTKAKFATQLGDLISQKLSDLPQCTISQELEINSSNLLSLTCRPSLISPGSSASIVENEIKDSDAFTSGNIITARNLSAQLDSSSGVYYQKAHKAPDYFKWLLRLPYISLLSIVICLVLIKLLALSNKKAWRTILSMLLLSGLLLIVFKLVVNTVNTKLDKYLGKRVDLNLFKQSFIGFINSIDIHIASKALVFGLAYVLIGVLIIFFLKTKGWHKRRLHRKKAQNIPEIVKKEPLDNHARLYRTPSKPSYNENLDIRPNKPSMVNTPTAPRLPSKSSSKRKLIQ